MHSVKDLFAKHREEQKFIPYRLRMLGWTQDEIGGKSGLKDNAGMDVLPVSNNPGMKVAVIPGMGDFYFKHLQFKRSSMFMTKKL